MSERLDKFDLDWLDLFDRSDWIEPDFDGNECSDALMWAGIPLTCVMRQPYINQHRMTCAPLTTKKAVQTLILDSKTNTHNSNLKIKDLSQDPVFSRQAALSDCCMRPHANSVLHINTINSSYSLLPDGWRGACDGSGVLCVLCEGGSVSGDNGDCGDGCDDYNPMC